MHTSLYHYAYVQKGSWNSYRWSFGASRLGLRLRSLRLFIPLSASGSPCHSRRAGLMHRLVFPTAAGIEILVFLWHMAGTSALGFPPLPRQVFKGSGLRTEPSQLRAVPAPDSFHLLSQTPSLKSCYHEQCQIPLLSGRGTRHTPPRPSALAADDTGLFVKGEHGDVSQDM